MLRHVIVATLALATHATPLACGTRVCENCSDATPTAPRFDAAAPDAVGDDATIESTAPETGVDTSFTFQPEAGMSATDASDEDVVSAATDASDRGADGCACSIVHGPCGALNPCGCCPFLGLSCVNDICIFSR